MYLFKSTVEPSVLLSPAPFNVSVGGPRRRQEDGELGKIELLCHSCPFCICVFLYLYLLFELNLYLCICCPPLACLGRTDHAPRSLTHTAVCLRCWLLRRMTRLHCLLPPYSCVFCICVFLYFLSKLNLYLCICSSVSAAGCYGG